jgi:D-aminoacyl-tRNA deacylase
VRALLQRVKAATVSVGDDQVGTIGPGLCVFVGVTHTDDTAIAARLAQRLWLLRIFPDEDGLTNRSAADLALEVLVVSQFTLYADTSRGRRPSFVQAAPPNHAEPLVDSVVATLRSHGATVATGRFGATMRVELVNDGPFTVLLDTEDRR